MAKNGRDAEAIRFHLPTRDELMGVAGRYALAADLSLSKLSAYALGDANLLPRAAKDPAKRIYLDTASRLLTYIEQNPVGVS